jgi:protein-serine/threonine kinase
VIQIKLLTTLIAEYDPRPLDVWSCAIVYLTMTFQGSPWTQARSTDDRYARFKQGWDNWLAKHPEGIITDETGLPSVGPIFSVDFLGSAAIKKLMIKMLNPDPDKRLTINEVLNTTFVKGIECCTLESCEAENNPMEDCCGKKFIKTIQRKHNHLPPKEHKTPTFLQHRFDMGDGYR